MNNEILIREIKKIRREYIWYHYSSFQLDKDKEIKEIIKFNKYKYK